MPTNIGFYGWTVPEGTDSPSGPEQFTELAKDIEATVRAIDLRAADSGIKDAITLTPATGWGTVSASGRRFGPLCVVHWAATRTGTAIAAAASGNIADTLILTITDSLFLPRYSVYSGFGISVGSAGRCFLSASPAGTLYVGQYVPNLAINTGDVLVGTLAYVGA